MTIPELKADIVFEARLRDQNLVFHSTWGLFSPKQIDEGTRLLLDHIDVVPNARILDLGCGYGPLGLTLAKLAPAGQKFDIIVSNVPAKIGSELLSIFLHDAYAHLNPGGALYIVTISGLKDYMKRHLTDVFGNYDKLKQSKTYTAAVGIKS